MIHQGIIYKFVVLGRLNDVLKCDFYWFEKENRLTILIIGEESFSNIRIILNLVSIIRNTYTMLKILFLGLVLVLHNTSGQYDDDYV